MSDIKLYEELVKILIEQKSSQIISNGMIAHAIILIREMMNNAKRNVRIFCHELNHEVYADLGIVESIKNAINRNITVNIIIQKEAPDEQSLDLIKLFENKILHSAIYSASDCARLAELPFNFCITDDGLMYRLEPDRNKPCARACMNASNDKEIKQIVSLFDSALGISKKLYPKEAF